MKYLVSVFILAGILFSSCDKTKNEQSLIKQTANPGFVHTVYFWLKKDNPELLKEFIDSGLPQLSKVHSIQNVYWGPPAGTGREVVDNSYDLSWIVMFANAEEQDKYQVDPIHVEFVEKYKSLFDRVQVYDSVVTDYK